jgi:hypothetical protein
MNKQIDTMYTQLYIFRQFIYQGMEKQLVKGKAQIKLSQLVKLRMNSQQSNCFSQSCNDAWSCRIEPRSDHDVPIAANCNFN